MAERNQEGSLLSSPDATANLEKQSRNVAYQCSISCHLQGNQLQPRHQATKSHSETNLARLVLDKRAERHSPIKQLEKRDSLSSLRSLNSYLSVVEGVDADYAFEDETVFNDETEEDDRRLLQGKPKLRQRQSMISGVSVNSLLSVVEDDSHVLNHVNSTPASADNPTIRILAPEDDERENKTLPENGQSRNTESLTEKKKKRRGTGRMTSDERSQTGRVSNLQYVGCLSHEPCLMTLAPTSLL